MRFLFFFTAKLNDRIEKETREAPILESKVFTFLSVDRSILRVLQRTSSDDRFTMIPVVVDSKRMYLKLVDVPSLVSFASQSRLKEVSEKNRHHLYSET